MMTLKSSCITTIDRNYPTTLWTDATMSASNSSNHISTWPLALEVAIMSLSWITSPSLLFMWVMSRVSVNSRRLMPSKHFFRWGCTLNPKNNTPLVNNVNINIFFQSLGLLKGLWKDAQWLNKAMVNSGMKSISISTYPGLIPATLPKVLLIQSFTGGIGDHNHNLQPSKVPLESQAQGSSLFTSMNMMSSRMWWTPCMATTQLIRVL